MTELRLVRFPELEGEPTLSFRNRDLFTLQNKLGKQLFMEAPDKINTFDFEWITDFLHHGGKTTDGSAKRPITLDECDGKLTLGDVAKRCLDAIFLSTHGKTFEEHLLWIAKNAGLDTSSLDNPSPLASPENS